LAYDKPSKGKALARLDTFFGGPGGYLGLKNVCRKVHLS